MLMCRMKSKIILALLFFISIGSNADNDLHMPAVGDFIQQQVNPLKFSQEDNGPVWDLSKLQTIENSYHVSFENSSYQEGVIVGTEHQTRYSYQQRNDTLQLWGYENSTSKVEYDMPEAIYKENLVIGNCMSGVFHGLEMYGGKLAFRLYGTYTYKPEAIGTIILPNGNSIRNAMMVHYTKNISKAKYPRVKTIEALRNLVFVTHPYNKDSIVTLQASDESTIIVDQYKWYAEGYRYPIYETITTSVKGHDELYSLAFYNDPKEQKKLYDTTNENVRQRQDRLNSFISLKNLKSENHSKGLSVSGEVVKGKGCISISLESDVSTNMDLSIYTLTGMLIEKKEDIPVMRGRQSYSFDIASNNSGIYIVLYNINGTISAIKIINGK